MENGDRLKFDAAASKLVKEAKAVKREIEELEEKLGDLKKKQVQITQFDLPDLLFEHGMTSCRLMDETTITILPLYYARLAKLGKEVDEIKKAAFIDWLRANGHGGIVKQHFEVFARDANTIPLLKDFCVAMGFEYDIDESIHYKTLEKWFGEMTIAKKPIDTGLFTNYVGSVAKIK